MPIHLFPSLLLYIIMVGYTPGPANIYALSCSLKYGRKSALRMWYGELFGFLIAVTCTIGTLCIGYNNLKRITEFIRIQEKLKYK